MNPRSLWWPLTAALYVALIGIICVWQLSRPEGPNVTIWALQLLPLLVFLPAVLRGWPRGLIGLCFVLLLYFVRAVEGVMASNRAWIDWGLLGLSVLLFICAMLASRAHPRRSPTPEMSG